MTDPDDLEDLLEPRDGSPDPALRAELLLRTERAVARAWLITTSEGMPVRTVEWSPSLALRVARRHPDLTEALLALVGTKLTTAPTGTLVAV